MKLENKIENVFHIKLQSTWIIVCPLRYYSQEKPIFLYYEYPRKLQNLDPNSIFFPVYNIKIFNFFSSSCFSQNFTRLKFFSTSCFWQNSIRFYDRFRFFILYFKGFSQKTTFLFTFFVKNSQKLKLPIFKRIITLPNINFFWKATVESFIWPSRRRIMKIKWNQYWILGLG